MEDYSVHMLEAHALLKKMSEAASRRNYMAAVGYAIDLGVTAIELLRLFRKLSAQ